MREIGMTQLMGRRGRVFLAAVVALVTLAGCQPSGPAVKVGSVNVAYDEVVETTPKTSEDVPRKSYYKDNVLTFTAYDTDGDGKDDLWLQYDDQLYLKLEMNDTNGDGKPDKFIYYDRDEKVIREETN